MPELGLFAKIAITSFSVIIAALLSVLIVRWLVRALRVEADQVEMLRLVNQGNCACQYHLSVTSPAPELKFTLYADDVPLAPVYEEIEERITETSVVETEERLQADVAVPAVDSRTNGAQKTEKVNTGDALQKGQDASAKMGVFANMLGIIGGILPGSLGKSVKGAAGGARKAQAKSAKVVQAPKSAQRKMDAMKRSGNRLGVQADKKQETNVAQPRTGTRSMRKQRKQAEISRSTREVVKTIKKTVEKVGVVQTVDLYPGEFLNVSLEIGKAGKRYPAGSFGYSISSQPVPLDKQLGNAPKALKKQQVHFAPIARWRYWLPSLSVSLYLLMVAALAYYFVLAIWM